MGGGAVKTIVMLMVLVVFSIIVGAQVSDGIKASFGAFVTIGAVAVGFVMLWLGKNAWYLLYLFPALLINCCFAPDYRHTVSIYPLEMMACAILPVYWALMSTMGFVHSKWRSLPLLDCMVAVVFIYFVASYIMHPVSIQSLDADADFVGGKEYFWCILAVVYYLSVSYMSGEDEEVLKVLKWSFFILCGAQLFYAGYQVFNGSLFRTMGRMSEGGRFPIFRVIAPAIIYFTICSIPLMQVLTSPRRFAVCSVCGVLTIMIGNREVFAAVAMAIAFAMFIKRQLTVFVLLGGVVYLVLLGLSSANVFMSMPHAFQRTIYILPGMKIRPSIARTTEASSNTRREIWKLAMDSRNGYIKDYLWGDGFQTSVAKMRRDKVAYMRGGRSSKREQNFNVGLAEYGNWHNGWIATIHRVGIVGLVVVTIVFGMVLYYYIVMARALMLRKEFPYIMALTLPYVGVVFTYPWGTQSVLNFFAAFQNIAVIKVLYCIMRDKGLTRPLIFREQYVPMTIRELEKTA